MKYLGPLSSKVEAYRTFYVDMRNQLNTNELITGAVLVSEDSDIVFDDYGQTLTDITTNDGTILQAGQTVYFRVSCNVEKTAVSAIRITYTTDNNNADSTTVYLKIVPTIQ